MLWGGGNTAPGAADDDGKSLAWAPSSRPRPLARPCAHIKGRLSEVCTRSTYVEGGVEDWSVAAELRTRVGPSLPARRNDTPFAQEEHSTPIA